MVFSQMLLGMLGNTKTTKTSTTYQSSIKKLLIMRGGVFY